MHGHDPKMEINCIFDIWYTGFPSLNYILVSFIYMGIIWPKISFLLFFSSGWGEGEMDKVSTFLFCLEGF